MPAPPVLHVASTPASPLLRPSEATREPSTAQETRCVSFWMARASALSALLISGPGRACWSTSLTRECVAAVQTPAGPTLQQGTSRRWPPKPSPIWTRQTAAFERKPAGLVARSRVHLPLPNAGSASQSLRVAQMLQRSLPQKGHGVRCSLLAFCLLPNRAQSSLSKPGRLRAEAADPDPDLLALTSRYSNRYDAMRHYRYKQNINLFYC